ncbi:hypothetical protein [Marisediminicola antarctica]|uniref:Uncharacterized protein n=1 Tax=Marisediminicola antarctica TaxID=674079 RepID=A0A7L5AGA4_9MICO|nr:hypothetical protein [Marisediminicola antarctica]QHO69006.1 hypothetical protein BHD05_04460 [Marisediminicola antarctica]
MTKAFFGDAGPTVVPPVTGSIPVQKSLASSPPVAVTPSAGVTAPFAVGSTTVRFNDASVRRFFARRHTVTG